MYRVKIKDHVINLDKVLFVKADFNYVSGNQSWFVHFDFGNENSVDVYIESENVAKNWITIINEIMGY
jgi:3D (Asp-Asp-Asp) domain-containing protein